MRKVILFVLTAACIFSFQLRQECLAQIINVETGAPCFFISDESDELELGVSRAITLSVPGLDPRSNIDVSANGAELTRIGGPITDQELETNTRTFNVLPTSSRGVELTVSVVVNGTKRIMGNVYYNVSRRQSVSTGVFVSPTKMNVLYRGVKNPISVSVSGVHPDLVNPSIEGGTLKPDSRAGKGNYIVEVFGDSQAKVAVSAEIDGRMKRMGEFVFRVKDVPPPVATIAGTEGGLISANRFASAPTIIPKMKNFDFELFFKVTKFDLVYQVGTDLITKPVTGSKIPSDAVAQIKRLKIGSRVYIENIKAVMLDSNNRPASGVTPKLLSPISLKIR